MGKKTAKKDVPGRKYAWVSGSRYSANADVVGHRLEKIEKANGRLTAQNVVDDATSTRSPLHGIFEWNDTRAAAEHRLEQARHLMRSITVTIKEAPNNGPVRAFVQICDANERVYANTVRVLSSAELREQLIQRAYQELVSWRDRYYHLKEFVDVFMAIDAEAARHAQRNRSRKTPKKRKRA